MSKKAEQARERAEAIEQLRAIVKPGMTVQTILRHVSRSGMSRSISAVVTTPDGAETIDWLLVRAGIGGGLDRTHDGVKMGGCGMDMGFALVYELSRVLFPDGFGCIGKGCPSNDHSNGDRDYTPNTVKQIGWAACDACCLAPDEQRNRNQGCPEHSHWHRSGGYALRHRWL